MSLGKAEETPEHDLTGEDAREDAVRDRCLLAKEGHPTEAASCQDLITVLQPPNV